MGRMELSSPSFPMPWAMFHPFAVLLFAVTATTNLTVPKIPELHKVTLRLKSPKRGDRAQAGVKPLLSVLTWGRNPEGVTEHSIGHSATPSGFSSLSHR